MKNEAAPFEISPKMGMVVAIVLAAVHFGLALWFSSITPYRQPGRILSNRRAQVQDVGAPDERQHANYIQHLLDGKGFPVFNPKDPNLYENYQSHQPPLYYLVAAGWATVTRATNVEDQASGFKIRALSALMGAGNVFLVFCLGLWGFRRVGVGVCAAAFAALLPMNVALSGSVSNDPLLFLLCTGALAVSALSVWDGWTTKRAFWVGVLTGLALLTKTTALELLPAILLAVVLSGEGKPKPAAWVAAVLPMILLPAGWWFRNQSLYGDPFAINAFNQAFTLSAQAKPFIEGFGLIGYLVSWVGWWTIRSFFGAFGYMDVWLNETGLPTGSAQNLLYRLLIAGTFLVVLGWISAFRNQTEKPMRVVQAMNATFLIVVALLFLKFNMQYFQAQARYLLPAIGPISCGFSVGLLALVKNRWPIALGILVVVLGGTTVYAGIRLPTEFEKRTASA